MHIPTIAIIGAGNMGRSLLGGLIANQFPAKNIWITDPDTEKQRILQQEFNIHTTSDNHAAIKVADVVILAVKPTILMEILSELKPTLEAKNPLIISIAAGVRIANIQKKLHHEYAIVRCMPNMPALIRAGITALYANKYVSKKQRDMAESMLRAVGIIVWLKDEKDMDLVTALSGSGPAYFFLVMEALQSAAEKLGLSSDIARLLTLQTALGAARMALESQETAQELRHRVTSPGGTTEAAISVFEKAQIADIFAQALTAAKNRSEELANKVS